MSCSDIQKDWRKREQKSVRQDEEVILSKKAFLKENQQVPR